MEGNLLANRYRVIEEIGHGGMAIVYRAYDTVGKHEVALKSFSKKIKAEPKLTQEKKVTLSTISIGLTEAELRFKQEFRTMVKLKHPNTVNVFDYGVLGDGTDYITMEIIAGKELSDILKDRRLSFSEIYRILIQVAQVLNFIHSRLLIHRDIKPSNIRITPEGNVKLMDFGLMDPMGLPSNGEIVGTAIYLPPEVAQGGIIDARSDLYSLGVVAYELVTGQPPFMADKTIELVKQHIGTPPVSPSRMRKDTPQKLEKIILRLLAKEQKKRYQTTAELIDALLKISDEKTVVETFEQRKSYLNSIELIGREKEMQQLKDIFALAKQRKGQSVFIAAPAGVGKSRLIQEFKLKVQLAETPFVQGKCFEQGLATYQSLAEALKALLPLTERNLIDKYGPVLVKLIPDLKNKGQKPAPDLDPVSEKVRLLEYTTNWLKEISLIKPITIYIEDLHWADLASVELLNGCVRELHNSAVMIIGCFRDDEVETTGSLFQTVEEGLTTIIKLSPLNQYNVEALIEKMLGQTELTEDFTAYMFTATGGNPFFVTEAMRGLIEEEKLILERGRWILPMDISRLELPTSIENTTLRRLKLVNQDSLKLARIAAVAGRDLDLSFLKKLSGLSENKLFDILDELLERQFMKVEEKLYVFTHDRVREVLYSQLTEEEKRIFHEKSANILESRHADNPDQIARQLGHHFNLGINKQKAIKYLFIAGEHSFARGNSTEACTIYKQAIYWLEQIDYLNKASLLLIYRDRIIETSYGTDPQHCLEICRKQLDDLLYSKKYNIERAIKIVNIIFKIINFILPTSLADRIKVKLATRSRIGSPKFGAHLQVTNDIGELVNLTARTMAYSTIALLGLGQMEECFKEIEKIFRFFPDRDSPSYIAIVLGTIAAYEMTGQYAKYDSHLKHAKEVEERQECIWAKLDRRIDWYALALLYTYLENLPAWLGRKLNEENLKKAMAICEEWNLIDVKYWIYETIACRYSFSGSNKEFSETIEKLMETSKKMGRPAFMEIWAYGHIIRFAIVQHDFITAEKWCSKLYNTASKLNHCFLINRAKVFLAVLLFNKGKINESISTLKEAIETSRRHKFIIIIEALYRLGEVYLEINKINEAEEILKDALKRNTSFEMENVFWSAKIYRALGRIYKRNKKFEKAKEYFEKSLSITKEEDLVLEEGITYLSICELYIDLTQHSFAREALQNAKSKFLEADSKYFLDQTHKLKVTLLAK